MIRRNITTTCLLWPCSDQPEGHWRWRSGAGPVRLDVQRPGTPCSCCRFFPPTEATPVKEHRLHSKGERGLRRCCHVGVTITSKAPGTARFGEGPRRTSITVWLLSDSIGLQWTRGPGVVLACFCFQNQKRRALLAGPTGNPRTFDVRASPPLTFLLSPLPAGLCDP